MLFACRERVDKALEVLGVEFIDVLVFRSGHGPGKVPLEETAKGMKVMRSNRA